VLIVRTQLQKLTALCLILVVGSLWGIADAVAQPQASAGKAKVDRLVMGLITPFLDYMRPWINGIADHNIQHDPAFEWLFEIDAETGQYVPWLAASWQLSPDGKAWRITACKQEKPCK
jgi:ABC-type transport system substrate-binding protein